jgi:hypothetical protein
VGAQEDDMTQWEYLVIEVWKGKVDSVNGELVSKTAKKDMYNLVEYLTKIGQEGWEVIGTGTKSLLIEPEHNEVEILLAKRQAPEVVPDA